MLLCLLHRTLQASWCWGQLGETVLLKLLLSLCRRIPYCQDMKPPITAAQLTLLHLLLPLLLLLVMVLLAENSMLVCCILLLAAAADAACSHVGIRPARGFPTVKLNLSYVQGLKQPHRWMTALCCSWAVLVANTVASCGGGRH